MNNLDLEKRIISTCIYKKGTFSDLKVTDFYNVNYQNMYRAMQDNIFDLDLDHISLKYGYDTEYYYLALEMSCTDESHLVPDLIDLSVRREEIRDCDLKKRDLSDLSKPIKTVRNLAAAVLSGDTLAEKCQKKWINKKKVKLGRFEHLNKKTYSLDRTHVALIAGRPGTGKTGFTWQLAEELAREQNELWLFFSAEMSDESMLSRMAKTYFYECYPHETIENSNIWFYDQVRENKDFAKEVIEEVCPNMLFLDSCGLTIPMLRAYIKSTKEIHGERVGTVVIDYVQLIIGDGGNRIEQQGNVARGLQMLAKEFDVRILALTQLNRCAEGEEPRKDQIKESSVWEDVADEIWGLWHKPVIEDAMIITHMKSRHNGSVGRSMLKKEGLYFDNPHDHELEEWRRLWGGEE